MKSALPPPAPPPVAIALEKMTTGELVTFHGIDLESGRQVTITIGMPEFANDLRPRAEISALGLVLTLAINRFAEAN